MLTHNDTQRHATPLGYLREGVRCCGTSASRVQTGFAKLIVRGPVPERHREERAKSLAQGQQQDEPRVGPVVHRGLRRYEGRKGPNVKLL